MSKLKRPLRVLVLDDDVKIVRLLRIFLKQQGYVVVTAADGREGLLRMLESSFDLLIVDVQMPVMDGLTFIDEVLSLWPWENIIFCTGYYNEQVRKKADHYGVRHVLEKPLSFNTLAEAIQDVCAPADASGNALSTRQEADISCELSSLREYTREALSHLHLGRAVCEFADTLAHVIPCAAAGVFAVEGDQSFQCVRSAAPLDDGYLREITGKVLRHYEVLSGKTLPGEPAPDIRVSDPAAKPIRGERHYNLMLPVAGKQTLAGMVWVVLDGVRSGPPPEMKHLLISAHHLSTLMDCLEHMRGIAIHDPLTGLFTRTYLDESIGPVWRSAERTGEALAVVSLDLDDFKTVNDREGYSVGDQVLKKVAEILNDAARKTSGMAVRTGGDDFMLLLSGCSRNKAETLSLGVLKDIRELNPYGPGGPFKVGASIGYALHEPRPGGGGASEQLMECAEQALFAAKRDGGGRVGSWEKLCETGQASYDLHPVLVVDDDPQVNLLIRRMLNKNMYEVTGTASVAEAVSLLEQGKRFHVLLTDLALPRQDGNDMIRLGREIDPDMVPVIVSGNISRESEKKLRQNGAFDIIQKPFDVSELRNVVTKAVESRSRSIRKDPSRSGAGLNKG